MNLDDVYVYDKSFPAYYYPAVFFINTAGVPVEAAESTVFAFKTYVNLQSDESLTDWERVLKRDALQAATIEQKTEIFLKIIKNLSHWKYDYEGDNHVPVWLIDKVMIMGAIAKFPRYN